MKPSQAVRHRSVVWKVFERAQELASYIRIGSLSLELTELRSSVVAAQLGEEAISTSLIAGLIGLIIVILFMIIAYRVPGAVAGLSLIFYTATILLTLNAFDITLTLPGIAGIILGIGMAVDANVIIYARIREEIGTGSTVRSAIKAGFSKAFSAIFDGNITTLIAAFRSDVAGYWFLLKDLHIHWHFGIVYFHCLQLWYFPDL